MSQSAVHCLQQQQPVLHGDEEADVMPCKLFGPLLCRRWSMLHQRCKVLIRQHRHFGGHSHITQTMLLHSLDRGHVLAPGKPC
jgi:HD-like signal output (HDOD) protein